ncbi:hypothetical protein ACNKHL_07330 [Shigella flexneri]
MSRFVPRIIPFYLLLLVAGGTANAQSTFSKKRQIPLIITMMVCRISALALPKIMMGKNILLKL